jgi:peptidoglycan/xylan/chitin deacetylase (PgdA/CDA1 family)
MFEAFTHILANNFSIILMMHRIAPFKANALPANENMNVPPEVLDIFITYAKSKGWAFISIDELHDRLVYQKKFLKTIVLTADDGYSDNYCYGLDVINAHKAPLCIYVTTSFPDRTAKLWWYALEDALLHGITHGSRPLSHLDKDSLNQRFLDLRALFLDNYSRAPEIFFEDHFPAFNLDWSRYHQNYCLNWENITTISREPLITLGAHTLTHSRLSALPLEDARYEIDHSRNKIQEMTGQKIEHFCYPFGGQTEVTQREFRIAQELGFKTATTTCNGYVLPSHKHYLTCLPRFMLEASSSLRQFTGWRKKIKSLIKKQPFAS